MTLPELIISLRSNLPKEARLIFSNAALHISILLPNKNFQEYFTVHSIKLLSLVFRAIQKLAFLSHILLYSIYNPYSNQHKL